MLLNVSTLMFQIMFENVRPVVIKVYKRKSDRTELYSIIILYELTYNTNT